MDLLFMGRLVSVIIPPPQTQPQLWARSAESAEAPHALAPERMRHDSWRPAPRLLPQAGGPALSPPLPPETSPEGPALGGPPSGNSHPRGWALSFPKGPEGGLSPRHTSPERGRSSSAHPAQPAAPSRDACPRLRCTAAHGDRQLGSSHQYSVPL